MYKIEHSCSITEDLNCDIVITNGAKVEIDAKFHGDIYLFHNSRIVVNADVYGTINATYSFIDCYATIHNGVTINGEGGKRYLKLGSTAHIIGYDLDTHKRNTETHNAIKAGKITLHPYPPSQS